MSKSIELELAWSKEEALKGSKLYYDYDMRNSAKRYIGWAFVGLVQFGIVGALKHDSFGLLYLSTFLVLYWYYGRWYLRKNMIERFYEKSNTQDTKLQLKISKNGVQINDALISWDLVLKVIDMEEGFLINTATNSLFLEKSSFQKPQDITFFKALLKEEEKL